MPKEYSMIIIRYLKTDLRTSTLSRGIKDILEILVGMMEAAGLTKHLKPSLDLSRD
jgi:hypothetical protein